MGNTASASLFTRPETSRRDFTASDMLLDQMEKQTRIDHATATTSCMETAFCYCAVVLSTMAALLLGSLTGSLEQPKKAPSLVDAACQTEDEVLSELTVNHDWQSCHVDSNCDVDDDNHSWTTESTDIESEDYEQAFNDDESDWESMSSAADDLLQDIRNVCKSCSDCDCEAQADQLLRLTAVVCAEESDSTPIYLEDYLCTCGECPHYMTIVDDVTTAATRCNEQQRQSMTRLLQAFSTYNEVLGYRADMIPAASECLRVWCGDEDKAFKSFVTLYDDVPQLCAFPNFD